MMLTTKSYYAVTALIEIATKNNDQPVRLADIAKNQTIPLNYLEQIFAKLKKSNLVKSAKGPGGGYSLNIASENISIGTIIAAVEENLKMTRCSQGKKCKQDGSKCQTHKLWKGLGEQISTYLANISVADILADQVNYGKL